MTITINSGTSTLHGAMIPRSGRVAGGPSGIRPSFLMC